ncbi:hypothetical protein FCL47_10390 [Desulfopila sp. IMCC35006]|nr:hypothetical protein FCL47_10390 [Desulfopila sp. IMCC35006]
MGGRFLQMQLKKRLAESLSARELKALVGAYDVVGDIAIVIIPEALTAKEQTIATAILASNRKIKVVAKRAGYYGGEFRTLPLQILAGEKRKETEVKEFGVRLVVNPETVYYSVRSGNERRRIASLVAPGESVLVLFSGIAPFPLVIARHSQAGTIIGIEKNPQAHAYAVTNLSRNKYHKNIELYLGDVRDVVPTLPAMFDRVIMPLPTRGAEFLSCALQALKANGVLHFYDMQRTALYDQSLAKISDASAACGRTVLSSTITRCGHCAPNIYRICIDSRIS